MKMALLARIFTFCTMNSFLFCKLEGSLVHYCMDILVIYSSTISGLEAWIGFNDEYNNDTYVWLTGSVLDQGHHCSCCS